MKISKIINKPKIKKEDLEKIDSTIIEIKDCFYCRMQKDKIKECAESKNVNDSLKSVTWHILKCSNCRIRIRFIVECKKRGHK